MLAVPVRKDRAGKKKKKNQQGGFLIKGQLKLLSLTSTETPSVRSVTLARSLWKAKPGPSLFKEISFTDVFPQDIHLGFNHKALRIQDKNTVWRKSQRDGKIFKEITQVRKLAMFRAHHLTSEGNVNFINVKETSIKVRHWIHLCVPE